jgi:hypothetical protein
MASANATPTPFGLIDLKGKYSDAFAKVLLHEATPPAPAVKARTVANVAARANPAASSSRL